MKFSKQQVLIGVIALLVIDISITVFCLTTTNANIGVAIFINLSKTVSYAAYICILEYKILGCVLLLISQVLSIVSDAFQTTSNNYLVSLRISITLAILIFIALTAHIIICNKHRIKNNNNDKLITYRYELYKLPIWLQIIYYSLIIMLVIHSSNTVTDVNDRYSLFVALVAVIPTVLTITAALTISTLSVVYTVYIIVSIVAIVLRQYTGIISTYLEMMLITEIVVYILWVVLRIKIERDNKLQKINTEGRIERAK